MAFILFTTLEQAEGYQALCDTTLGYPETVDRVEFQGTAVWADPTLGLAQNYHPIMFDADNVRIALPKVDGITAPEGATEVEALPEDWYPPAPEFPVEELAGE